MHRERSLLCTNALLTDCVLRAAYYTLAASVDSVIVLSHWPHVATQVEQQVAELVAQLVFAMYFNGTVHTGHIVEQQVQTHF